MRVLVTGAAGFIGSHVCERLVARRPRGGRHRRPVDRLDGEPRRHSRAPRRGVDPRPRRARRRVRGRRRRSSTSRPARRCPDRSPIPSPATRPTPPARCGCSKLPARSTTRSWSSRRRRRCTAPTPHCRSARTSPPSRSARTRSASSPPSSTRWRGSTATGCGRWRSGSSTCSDPARRPATPTPP